MLSNISSQNLLSSAKANNYEEVIEVLAAGTEVVNTNLQDRSGKTALHWAVIHLDPFMTYILLNNFAVNGRENCNIIKPTINIQDYKGATILHLLAKTMNKLKFTNIDNSFYKSDNYIILQILFNYNINVNIQDNKGNTALHYAIYTNKTYSKNIFFVKELLSHGASPFILNNTKHSILDYLNINQSNSAKELIDFIYSNYSDSIALSQIDNKIIIYDTQKLLYNLSYSINENNTINFHFNDQMLLGDNINNNA